MSLTAVSATPSHSNAIAPPSNKPTPAKAVPVASSSSRPSSIVQIKTEQVSKVAKNKEILDTPEKPKSNENKQLSSIIRPTSVMSQIKGAQASKIKDKSVDTAQITPKPGRIDIQA
ncbi:MAG: hypothetical protein HQL94_05700 [Magnetococcales bacterium]|nr:hypothetical protein [Magnetococcales bacterium]MBF0437851.1 hypothetical protein [Magnetococcales bacterium]